MKLAPIVLFTYKRPVHTQNTIKSLQENYLASESDLYVFSDGPKSQNDENNVSEVRRYIKSINGFKSVSLIERDSNYGLARNITEGIGQIISEYKRVIVLEEDLISSKYFLTFLNNGLSYYEKQHEISQISGFSPFEKYIDKFNLKDLVFIKGADCLGWGTWEDRWMKLNMDADYLYQEIMKKELIFEFDRENNFGYFKMLKNAAEGKVNSWAIKWYASAFLNNMYTVYPCKSYIKHIGSDNESTHYSNFSFSDPFNVSLNESLIEFTSLSAFEESGSKKAYNSFVKSLKLPLYLKALIKLRKLFYK